MPYLPFIKDEDLKKHVQWVLRIAESSSEDEDFFKNSIDPFSAIFDAVRQQISLSEWKKLEKMRQGQKTLQNRLGEFHQAILGSMKGWENLETGQLVDIKSVEKKIIAEIKNKHNTVKGSDKIAIYDNLEFALSKTYESYKGYYVEIIPQAKKQYDRLFTPSDNKTKERRLENERIRVIDGVSFYSLASGYSNALKMLYEILPEVISDVTGITVEKIIEDDMFKTLFDNTFSE